MIAGNHEYYGGSWAHERSLLRRQAQRQGVHFLEQETCDFPELGVRVAGATLWTDFDLEGAHFRDHAMAAASRYMNDYVYVSRFGPEKARRTHVRTLRWLEAEGSARPARGSPWWS